MKQKIYAIEDDAALQELYTYSLENEFECRCFDDWDSFSKVITESLPDLILLDIMLPGDDGFTILSKLKEDKVTSHIPVILVSAKGDEISKVKGLNLGADDYIAKPFGVLELVARIKANLRKSKMTDANYIEFKDIVIDSSKYQIIINGKNVQTTLKEYNLLYLLCSNSEKVQERENIFSEIWGDGFIGETRTLDIHIKELRKKLSEAESKAEIKTIRGVGYLIQ